MIAEFGIAPTLRSVYSGLDRQGQRFSQVFFASGGMGGSAIQDGHNCTAFPTNTGSGSIEAFESISPLIVWRKELRADSGEQVVFVAGSGRMSRSRSCRRPPASLVAVRSPEISTGGLAGGGNGAAVEMSCRTAAGRTRSRAGRSIPAIG